MKHFRTVTILVVLICVLSGIAASIGIYSQSGDGKFEYQSIRGETVEIHGIGIYKHMSAEVAPQGIAQDYITLFVGIPLLLFSLMWAQKGSVKGKYVLAGTLGYFLVTYLFYLMMGMYNALFLVYVALLCTTFFSFSLTLLSFNVNTLPDQYSEHTPNRFAGGFLLFNSTVITLLWLGVVVPPLVDGSVIPKETEHYTTLVVQGLDLGLLLPLAFVSGYLFLKKRPFGYLLAPVYLIFLTILMTALTAKIIAMGNLGYSTMPAIFIIPSFGIIAFVCSFWTLKNIK